MSSLLNQAVELAQAGQRDQARQLLWQYVQTNPDNEVAWLWLASVAADQPEYVRALNEVLRINPAHERARQLLDDFQRQYGSVPSASTPPYARAVPPQQAGQGAAPPTSPPPSPPPTPAYQPPPAYEPAPSYTPVYGTPDYDQPRKPVEREHVVERERVVERRGRRGCGCLPGCGCLGCGGCGQSCLVAVVLLIVLPIVLLSALSRSSFSLGPLDWLALPLPGEFGTKTLQFDSGEYEIKLDAPRSWYLVSDQNDMWVFSRDILHEAVKFEDAQRIWEDFEDSPRPIILETNLIALLMNGDVIGLMLSDEVPGDFNCAAVNARRGEFDAVHTYADNLCGYSIETVRPYSGSNVFTGATPPTEVRDYVFVVPVNDALGLQWELTIAEDLHGFYGERIARLIDSVEVTQK